MGFLLLETEIDGDEARVPDLRSQAQSQPGFEIGLKKSRDPGYGVARVGRA
jgi:hypothetical protein